MEQKCKRTSKENLLNQSVVPLFSIKQN